MQPFAIFSLLLAAAVSVYAQIKDPVEAAALVSKLLTAPTQVARFNLLNDTDFVFDFGAGVGLAQGAGGSVTTANAADFPAVIGNGMALALGSMGEPCGMNTPHTHPRATEFLFVVSGSQLQVGFIEENGARYVENNIKPGQGTIFPKGSIHYQANLGCEKLQFIAGLNNVDPGVLAVAQRYFGLSPEVVDASLGNVGLAGVVEVSQKIPDNMAIGVQKCLDACKLQRGEQPIKQQQLRVPANAFPTESLSDSGSWPSGTPHKKRSLSNESPAVASNSKPPASIDNLIRVLQLVVGVMLLGYAIVGVNYIRRRRESAIELPGSEQVVQVVKN